MESPNFQPSTFSHQDRVARGSALASSVCVMTPCRDLDPTLDAAAAFRAGRRVTVRFFAVFLVDFLAAFFVDFLATFFAVFLAAFFALRFAGLRLAIESSEFGS
jgi:hypothetical protein